jgi:Protein of unknown function (DUF3037)
VPNPSAYDYAVIRVVPRVEREEFVNAGVVVSCPERNFLEARIALDPARVAALDPTLDIESIRAHLEAIALICRGGEAAGPIGRLTPRERFHWLVAPRSAVIQLSPAHTGQCEDPDTLLARLMATMVETPRA